MRFTIKAVTALMLAVVGLASLPLTSCSDDNDEILQVQPDEYTFGPRRVFSRLWYHAPHLFFVKYDNGLLVSFGLSHAASIDYYRNTDGRIDKVIIDYPMDLIANTYGKLCTVMIGENGFASEIIETDYFETFHTVYRISYNDQWQLAKCEIVKTDQWKHETTTIFDAVYADGNLVSWGDYKFEYSPELNKCGYFGSFLLDSNLLDSNLLDACYYAGLLGMPPSRTMMSSLSYVDKEGRENRCDYEWDMSDDGYPASLNLYQIYWTDIERLETTIYMRHFFDPDVRSSRALWQADMPRHR